MDIYFDYLCCSLSAWFLLLVFQYVVVRSGCVDVSITCIGVVSGAGASMALAVLVALVVSVV